MSGVGRALTGSAEFLQQYMPPELQNGSGGYGAGCGQATLLALAGGVPPLGPI